jgi:hypothetical protein
MFMVTRKPISVIRTVAMKKGIVKGNVNSKLCCVSISVINHSGGEI